MTNYFHGEIDGIFHKNLPISPSPFCFLFFIRFPLPSTSLNVDNATIRGRKSLRNKQASVRDPNEHGNHVDVAGQLLMARRGRLASICDPAGEMICKPPLHIRTRFICVMQKRPTRSWSARASCKARRESSPGIISHVPRRCFTRLSAKWTPHRPFVIRCNISNRFQA